MRPLEGVTVVALEHVIAGPFCTRQLADLGARIINIVLVQNLAPGDLWDHAQLRARRRCVDVDTPVGKIKAMLPPGVPESFEPRMDPLPGIGQHTDRILEELGCDARAIAKLRAERVI